MLVNLDQAKMFVQNVANERMWNYHWAPGTMNPRAVIKGFQMMGVDTSPWGESRVSRSRSATELSGLPAEEGEQLVLLVGAGRWLDLGPERLRAAHRVAVPLGLLADVRDVFGVDVLVEAGRRGRGPIRGRPGRRRGTGRPRLSNVVRP